MPNTKVNNTSFQQEILDMLQPKIHAVLRHTRPQERDDLKQEICLMIIQTIQTKRFKEAPSFFELVETEKLAQNEL
ncbi:hypothetical protein [Metasolibacillus fluoroglycofenilyticus]|uniref:hypothetical protein n=1 Tax=Metasolibacillus fluoroglycofenilyticus TaxID=1239396 RepID=UPI000D3C97A6|nr:hypothetical protein [Metasolibacillus fluoroglycofenilyticus]